MARTTLSSRRRAAAAVVVLALGTACDADSDVTAPPVLAPRFVSDSVIARQGTIRVVLGAAVDPATALNPENFVVINECTGLRVTGALALSGDTLAFTPNTALPFLTALSVRVQNVLTPSGQVLKQPFTFRLRTENPPVSDVSWQAINSPTNDIIGGVAFANRQVGYIVTTSGSLYRTDNGGQLYAAIFKNPNINGFRNIRPVSAAEAFVVGTRNRTGGFDAVLFQTLDSGRTLNPRYTVPNASFFSLNLRRRATGAPLAIMGGNLNGSLASFRYDLQNDSAHVYGPIAGQNGQAADLSPDGSHAAIVGISFTGVGGGAVGRAHYSRDGGRTFQERSLPANTPLLAGLGFVNNTTALLLGDSSTVIRLNTETGDTARLGAANGIPQTITGPAPGQVTSYSFVHYEPAPDAPQLGWLVGTEIRRIPGTPDVRRGVILITRDGGQTFVRQAVEGAGDFGVGFPGLRDVFVLDRNFAAVGGLNGFVAIRPVDTSAAAGVCSFSGSSSSN